MKNNIRFFMTRLLIRVLPILYMGLIWFLSSHPSDAIVDTGSPYDRTFKESLHLIEFAILYCLLVLSLMSFKRLNPQTSYKAAFLAVFYGLLDEIHQYFVPSRSATVTDLLKDALGVFIVWYIINKGLTDKRSKVSRFLKRLQNKMD